MAYIVSICIPTYNGAATLRDTLDRIVAQYTPEVEIVLCDDESRDDTFSIANDYRERFPRFRVERNAENLGMDRNFLKVASLASGTYVWFFGQDDRIMPGTIERVVQLLSKHPRLGFLNLDFSQHNHDFSRVICASVMRRDSHWEPGLEGKDSLFFDDIDEYFRIFSKVPSFLPATVVRRQFLVDSTLELFFGTHYLQVASILLNMRGWEIGVVTIPLVQGRIPDNGWQNNGQQYYSIMVGSMVTEALVYRDPRNPIPQYIYEASKRRFLRDYFFLVERSKKLGFCPKHEHYYNLRTIFGHGIIYYLYLNPITTMPLSYFKVLRRLVHLFK